MSSQPLTSTQFGESEFGQRLEYKKPAYRDLFFAILYYVHLVVIMGAGIYLWMFEYKSDGSSSSDWGDAPLTGIIVGVVACLLTGIIFGLFWLQVMKRFAMSIIKGMLFLNIGCWCAVALIGLATGNMVFAIIGLICALLFALYMWCIWSRIPFASALLSVSSAITSQYGGTVFLSLCVILFDVLWIFIWGSCASAYYISVDEEQQSAVIIFLLFVSLYWGFQVHQNISHTTTCGVTATWYFSTEINYNPTTPAFKRTMTSSFGSVCLGSLIVAILEALKTMVRSAQNDKNAFLTCLLECLLNCIENMVRWFNKYAYAQCAIYGTSFLTSAKKTWQLFTKRGILALINDDLTGLAIFAGALIGGIVSAGVGFAVGYAFYNGNDDHDIRTGIPIALAVYGFFIGLILCQTVLYVVHSSIICLFVCYCEDPAALQQNRPEEFQRICDAKPEFATVENQL